VLEQELGNRGVVMKRVGWCVVAASAAMLWDGLARAESEAEYRNPGPATAALSGATEPTPKPRLVARPAMFAAAAVANAKPLSAQEREEWRFLKDAAATNRFQTEAARLALVKSKAPAVRSLAGTLIDPRNTSGNELLRLLHMRGMAPPMLANYQRKTLNRLARLQGTKFDREFVAQVGLKSQRDEVQYYEKAGASVGDPVLKDWIARTLPALRDQLATAERVAAPEIKLARNGASVKRPASSRHAAAAPSASHSTLPGAGLDTQAVGATPAQLRVRAPDTSQPSAREPGAVQADAARPIAARPSELNSR
jgi:putative membrane protein